MPTGSFETGDLSARSDKSHLLPEIKKRKKNNDWFSVFIRLCGDATFCGSMIRGPDYKDQDKVVLQNIHTHTHTTHGHENIQKSESIPFVFVVKNV